MRSNSSILAAVAEFFLDFSRSRASLDRMKKTVSLALLIFVLLAVALPAAATGSHSVARRWNDLTLDSVRKDLARPTVHARNLFHLSLAMWDAWATFDATAAPVLFGEEHIAADTSAAREEAISYAVYRVLRARFAGSPGAATVLPTYDALMADLGYSVSVTTAVGNSPAAIGNRIAARILAFGLQDGSNEAGGYANQVYATVNPPLLPALAGNPDIVDMNRWQPLALEYFVDQSGNPILGGYPDFLGPEWGEVTPFALAPLHRTIRQRNGYGWSIWHDPGPPPLFGTDTDAAYRWGFELVAAWSGHLDPKDDVMWDISPGSIGAAVLPETPDDWASFYDFTGGGDGSPGYTLNPVTGQPYAEQLVPRGDYVRVLAEFWADGPDSETPPGHWFVILNYVNDHELLEKRIGGEGDLVDDLEWDVKAYMLLGGAMHDAAIAAWSVKGYYDFVRPISALRALADRGQSSDAAALSYHPDGIRLYPEIIELVTSETTRRRRKHRHLRGHEGKIALKVWQGHDEVSNSLRDTAGVGWILAENWWPYQRASFVTPFFAGYVSGHSTYSRTAAVVMHRLTGSPFFPGGLGEFAAPKDEFLVFEDGPSVDVTLQWASYYDASDQCSLSRIWGGIHPPADDIPGRKMGDEIGPAVWVRANQYWRGEVPTLAIGLDTLPPAEEDLPYEVDLGIGGGTPPYDCRVVEGEFPEGLVLSPDGRITGTPQRRRGARSIRVSVEDALGGRLERSYELESLKAFKLGARRFRRGRDGRKYRMRLKPKRGLPPYQIRITQGALPPGLAINSEKYRIEGIPAGDGFFPLELEVEDALGARGRVSGEIFLRPAK